MLPQEETHHWEKSRARHAQQCRMMHTRLGITEHSTMPHHPIAPKRATQWNCLWAFSFLRTQSAFSVELANNHENRHKAAAKIDAHLFYESLRIICPQFRQRLTMNTNKGYPAEWFNYCRKACVSMQIANKHCLSNGNLLGKNRRYQELHDSVIDRRIVSISMMCKWKTL